MFPEFKIFKMSGPVLTCGAYLAAGVITSSLHCPAVPPLGTVLPFLHLLAHLGPLGRVYPSSDSQWKGEMELEEESHSQLSS